MKNVRLDAKLLKKLGIFSIVSGELLACVGGGYLLGNWLDKKLNASPYFTAGFLVVGLVYSTWRIFQAGKESMKDE